ncbi:MAG TPA: SRPBCC family protein [Solirubrobacteraceae bacterium]
MLHYEADTDASPATAWALIACPSRWPEWSPHVRGGWRLGWPQVQEGSLGALRLFGAVPVPAKITRVDAGHAWEWRVGLVTMDHIVEPREEGGSRVTITISAPGPFEATLKRTYGPFIQRLVDRLARTADEAVGLGG